LWGRFQARVGRRALARRLWRHSRDAAMKLHLAYDQALAEMELGLTASDATERAQRLALAREILQRRLARHDLSRLGD
jgi:hypothetical protein